MAVFTAIPLKQGYSVGTVEIITGSTGISTFQTIHPDGAHIDEEVIIVRFLYQVVVVIKIAGSVIISVGSGCHLHI